MRRIRSQRQYLCHDLKQQLEIGLERSGHTSGYWYLANISESKGEITVAGSIVHIDGCWQQKKQKASIAMIFLEILFAPLTIMSFLLLQVIKLFSKQSAPSREERLDLFMTVYAGCIKKHPKPRQINTKLPYLPESEILQQAKYKELHINTVRLYFSDDFRYRIEIYHNDIGSYQYCRSQFIFFDSEEIRWSESYGYWSSMDLLVSFFADEILVLRELSNELSFYKEDETFRSSD